jgi:hypothetical protein
LLLHERLFISEAEYIGRLMHKMSANLNPNFQTDDIL